MRLGRLDPVWAGAGRVLREVNAALAARHGRHRASRHGAGK